jgi:ribosomal protein S18 acetylase RimI-like enzyme
VPITIRRAAAADAETLAPLFDAYRTFYGKTGDLPGARCFVGQRLEREESVVFLAFDGAEAVGFTQLYPSFSSVSMARIFVLNDLFVAPAGRRKGAGAALLDAAAKFARDAGAARLTLSTGVSNATAQSLYERLGWERDAEFYVYELRL